MIKFPFTDKDIIMFPDTESEYVDVGIGEMKVAENSCNTICRPVKKGKGYTLRFMYDTDYSEAFNQKGRSKSGKIQYLSLKEYLEYFGDFDSLKAIGIYNKKKRKEEWEEEI